ncbi:hypothetical protein GCK32_000619 [Trichostrongylus colubriformis]|uniref:Uncharacterized protein n=1 Tax=Trichostrongylus colubriformis TaxID=6319 RepID=A0AAN8IRX8_TRICO
MAMDDAIHRLDIAAEITVAQIKIAVLLYSVKQCLSLDISNGYFYWFLAYMEVDMDAVHRVWVDGLS